MSSAKGPHDELRSPSSPQLLSPPTSPQFFSAGSGSTRFPRASEGDVNKPLFEEELANLPPPPDGGWGWVICFSSFMCNLILDGIAYTFGVLLEPLVVAFDANRSTISWVGSILCGVYLMSGKKLKIIFIPHCFLFHFQKWVMRANNEFPKQKKMLHVI